MIYFIPGKPKVVGICPAEKGGGTAADSQGEGCEGEGEAEALAEAEAEGEGEAEGEDGGGGGDSDEEGGEKGKKTAAASFLQKKVLFKLFKGKRGDVVNVNIDLALMGGAPVGAAGGGRGGDGVCPPEAPPDAFP